MNLKLISAYFHSINERKSEEGFNSINLVLRQVDAFCGLCNKVILYLSFNPSSIITFKRNKRTLITDFLDSREKHLSTKLQSKKSIVGFIINFDQVIEL